MASQQSQQAGAVSNGLGNISHITGSIGSWVEAVDTAAAQQPPASAYRRTETIRDGIKTVVDYVEDPEKGRCKVTTTYKVVTKTVPKCVALRRNWTKFGASAHDGAGPQIYTTYVAEEVRITFTRNRHGELLDLQEGGAAGIQAEIDRRGLASKGMHCRFCKADDHWSVSCPYKEMYQQAFGAEGDPAGAGPQGGDGAVPFPPNLRQPPPSLGGPGGGMSAPGGAGRYVAPFARGDRPSSGVGPAGIGASTERRTDDFTCRVTNLPEDSDSLDEDLRAMFGSVGRIERFYLARDKQTNKPKGFAFVTFSNRQDAERAIERFNGAKMEHLILKVEWTKQN